MAGKWWDPACNPNGPGHELVAFIVLEHPVMWQEVTGATGETAPRQRQDSGQLLQAILEERDPSFRTLAITADTAQKTPRYS